MNINFLNHSHLEKIKKNNSLKNSNWKFYGILLLFFLFFIFFIFSYFSNHIQYQIVYNNLSNEDSILIISNLLKRKIPYRYIANSGKLLVPKDQIDKVNLMLLNEKLPKKKSIGFELFDKEKIGISAFNFQINYQRALEGELEKTIQKINLIRTATVHIAFPESLSLTQDKSLPSASIILDIKKKKHLTHKQCIAITNLISASVPNLLPKNVVILDEYGNYLNKKKIYKNNIQYSKIDKIKFIENKYRKKIIYILKSIFKLNNIHAQVTILDQKDNNFKINNFKLIHYNNFIVKNINNFFNSVFLNKSNHLIYESSNSKKTISVLILINDLKNQTNKIIPINNTQINNVKKIIIDYLKYENFNIKNIQIINLQLINNSKIIVNDFFLIYYFNLFRKYLLYIILFLFFIQFIYFFILRNNNINNKNYKININNKKINLDNMNKDINLINFKDNIKTIYKNDKLMNKILYISKNNPKLIAMIIKNWINKKK
ncbi:flagellar basal-body MS-ring/collar protein FliF [Buchnera aphidicola]|nr:flagellar basal-body MS-ring/collar protein FliF [Buchnera aphidicola]